VIGWLYDLVGRRVEKGELGERRHELLSGLEGTVLELGAGTGNNLPHYERASRVVAVEPDTSMAKQLRKRLPEASVPVEIVQSSADALPFEDAAFDTAVITFVLCSVEDQRRVLAEVWRVLGPGGRLVLLEHVRGEGRVARWQDRMTPLHRKLGNCHLNRETRKEIAAAGFDVAGVRDVRIPGSHPLVRAGIQGVAIKTSS
jgi:ubiquinone/menaquinone biosynthesis C-methylase UbiE